MKESKMFQDLQYVEFGCNKNNGNFIEHYKSNNGSKNGDQNAQPMFPGDDLWTSSLGLFASIIGCQKSDIQPSKWKEYFPMRERFFNAPVWKEFHWKSFNGLIHFRGKNVLDRNIDNFFIDLYFSFSSDSYETTSDSELLNNLGVLNELNLLKNQIQEALSQIAQVVLNDKSVAVKISDPIWEEECVPVYGGDGYWLKGIIF